MTDRASAIVARFIEAFGGQSTRQSDPRQVFERLAQHVEGLEPDELGGAADLAKRLGAELNSLNSGLCKPNSKPSVAVDPWLAVAGRPALKNTAPASHRQTERNKSMETNEVQIDEEHRKRISDAIVHAVGAHFPTPRIPRCCWPS